jgi:hypothetical protein
MIDGMMITDTALNHRTSSITRWESISSCSLLAMFWMYLDEINGVSPK